MWLLMPLNAKRWQLNKGGKVNGRKLTKLPLPKVGGVGHANNTSLLVTHVLPEVTAALIAPTQ